MYGEVIDGDWPEGLVPDSPPRRATMVLFHDDPPCEARLVGGQCPVCKIFPDNQSTVIRFFCPECNISLDRGPTCTKCGNIFGRF